LVEIGYFWRFLPFWRFFDSFWQNGSVFAKHCERRELLIFGRKSGIFGVFLPFWLIFEIFWQNGSVFANCCERRELLIFGQNRVFLAFFCHFG
jgi:hypothetical protein